MLPAGLGFDRHIKAAKALLNPLAKGSLPMTTRGSQPNSARPSGHEFASPELPKPPFTDSGGSRARHQSFKTLHGSQRQKGSESEAPSSVRICSCRTQMAGPRSRPRICHWLQHSRPRRTVTCLQCHPHRGTMIGSSSSAQPLRFAQPTSRKPSRLGTTHHHSR